MLVLRVASIRAVRRHGIGDAVEMSLPKKKTGKGLSQSQMTESFILLSALGGECPEILE
jgi:hypothetical protein